MTDDQGFLHEVYSAFGGIAAFAQHRLAEHRLNQERLALLRDSPAQGPRAPDFGPGRGD